MQGILLMLVFLAILFTADQIRRTRIEISDRLERLQRSLDERAGNGAG